MGRKDRQELLRVIGEGWESDVRRLTKPFLFLKSGNLNACDEYGETALMLAIYKDHSTIAKLLIERGADIHAKADNGNTALWRACVKPWNRDLVKILVDKGANVNARGNCDTTPLHWVCRNGETGSARLLIAKGANVNVGDHIGTTPLIEASEHGATEIMGMLLDAGANIDAKTVHGSTALIGAVYLGREGSVRFLVERGADITVRNEDGFTAADVASRNRDHGVLAILESKQKR